MPELPEVETSRRGIAPHCVGQVIAELQVRQPKLRWPVQPDLPQLMRRQLIASVDRRGKYLLLQVADASLMIHLGMSGSLRVLSSPQAAGKHDHIDILLANGKTIRYNDPRRFGSFIYNTQGLSHPLLEKLGPEPLSATFTPEYFQLMCKARKAAIKTVLMNSNIVVGVGNIYAQESLFICGIHPKRPANKISFERISHLVDAVKLTLQKAIIAGGSSLKDFTSAEGKPGYFQHSFQVYGKEGEACPRCAKPLKHAVISQRATVYCANCQR